MPKNNLKVALIHRYTRDQGWSIMYRWLVMHSAQATGDLNGHPSPTVPSARILAVPVKVRWPELGGHAVNQMTPDFKAQRTLAGIR